MTEVTRRTIKIGLIVWTQALLVMGCGLNPFLPRPTPTPAPRLLQQWLYDPTCPPPCWENIIPGETTIDEAVQILGNNPYVKMDFPPTEALTGIDTQWGFIDPYGAVSVWADKNTRIVNFVDFDARLPLKTVASVHGDPSHVKFVECSGNFTFSMRCSIYLIYLQSGLVLELYLDENGKDNFRVEILPESLVEVICFIQPGIDGFNNSLIFRGYPNSSLIPWEGYGKYTGPYRWKEP